jgi:hypothetical protein
MIAVQRRTTATVDGSDDLTASLERQRRERELLELAASEGIELPLPAKWIARLESKGIVVDLVTGAWMLDDVRYTPTEQALIWGGE